MKIFVGHSFQDIDKPVINEIKAFLSNIEGVELISGLRPQNKSVSDKIKERIESCDVFLGVFTKDREFCFHKELNFINWIRRRFPVNKYSTSAWVIQESGYAIGKEKELIFLVEEGIDSLPSLQGDLEFIPFNREDFTKAEVSLQTMIHQLMKGVPASRVKEKSVPPEKTKVHDEEIDKKKPDELEFDTAFDEMLLKLRKKEIKEIKEAEIIYTTKVKSGLKPNQIDFWDSLILHHKFIKGDAKALNDLEHKSKESSNPDIHRQLAFCYSYAGRRTEAITVYRKCIELEDSVELKVTFSRHISECMIKDGQNENAIDNLLAAMNDHSYKECHVQLLEALLSISDDTNNNFLYCVFAEKYLELNPGNTDVRFKIAYKYSNMGLKKLAIYHYKRLLEVESESGTLNNIGIAYEALGLKGRGNEHLRKSKELNCTLAHANLAQNYLDAGLLDDAKHTLAEAEEISRNEKIELSTNVGSARNKLKTILEEEHEKEADILKKAEKIKCFRVKHASALCNTSGITPTFDFSGQWVLDMWKGEVDAKHDSKTGKFKGVAEFDVPDESGFFASLFYPAMGVVAPEKKYKTRNISIKGTLKNNSGKYELQVREWKKGEKPAVRKTLLSGDSDEIYSAKGLFILSEDKLQLDCLEHDSKDEHKFISIQRKANEQS